jgi:hypoxanthine-DNA glycosylase
MLADNRLMTTFVSGLRCESFPPAARDDAHILILGSMPGIASLRAQQYYAHPRNLFWPFIDEIFATPPEPDYARRIARLQTRGVAVWDVLAACERPGSLDGRIVRSTEVVNDFAAFFATHRALTRICLNGAKAAEAFDRHVARTLPDAIAGLQIVRLPSTSPANASQPRARKLALWRAALRADSPNGGQS